MKVAPREQHSLRREDIQRRRPARLTDETTPWTIVKRLRSYKY